MLNSVNTVEKSFPKSVYCLCGPTAVGKTRVAINLAKALKTEIISFDSRQFYKEIPIGTAAPDFEERLEVSHHFILDRSIQQEFNAQDFADAALKRIAELHKRFDQVVVVGGSGLYLKALIEGFDPMPPVRIGLREELGQELERHGLAPLQAELKLKDPVYFKTVDINNPQRVIRALEVIRSAQGTFSEHRQAKKRVLPFEVIKIGLNLERSILYERINKRVDLMVDQGLIEEVRAVAKFQHLNALQTVGYKELFAYFRGDYNYDQALEEIKKNSRRYAKRQITWFKRDPDLNWYQPQEWEMILDGD